MDLKRVDPVIKSMSYISDITLTAFYFLIGYISITISIFIVYKFGTADDDFLWAINLFSIMFLISTGIKIITLVYARWRLHEDT